MARLMARPRGLHRNAKRGTAKTMNLLRKHLGWIGIVVVVSTVMLWKFVAKPASAGNRVMDPFKVAAVVVVQRRPIENGVTLSGEFRPYQQVDVHAKVA